jgi:hypothetical protein
VVSLEFLASVGPKSSLARPSGNEVMPLASMVAAMDAGRNGFSRRITMAVGLESRDCGVRNSAPARA